MEKPVRNIISNFIGAIRDVARYVSEKYRTIIVDSSSEISGYGDVPHASVGEARVMKIPESKNQEKIMIEAIQNHTPDILIIDEIGTTMEVLAAKDCSQRGIVLYASAHGSVKNLEKNQTVVGLVGGIQTVIMSDSQIEDQTKKVQRRLKYKPIFDIIIELNKENKFEWKIYHDVQSLMDNILQEKSFEIEIRKYNPEKKKVEIRKEMHSIDEE